MKLKGKKLDFISLIKRTELIDVSSRDMAFAANDRFKINALSLTDKTYIASGMSSYIVRLKP